MAQYNFYGMTTRADRGRRTLTVIEQADNDSDKTIVVPANQHWEVESIYVSLAASADVGDRLMTLILNAETDTITFCRVNADSTQAQSTTEYYVFSSVYQEAVESPAGRHFAPLPVIHFDSTDTIHVLDSATIAPAADDMHVYVRGYSY